MRLEAYNCIGCCTNVHMYMDILGAHMSKGMKSMIEKYVL